MDPAYICPTIGLRIAFRVIPKIVCVLAKLNRRLTNRGLVRLKFSNMHASNANQEERSLGFGWYLLGDYPLSIFLLDKEKGDQGLPRLLTQTIQGGGLPAGCLQNIEWMLKNVIMEALSHYKSGLTDLPARIRIFIQMKMISQEMKGGLGYFVIERSRDASSSDCTEPFCDFYIYEEGE
jgi:hypothetical protein